MAKLNIITRAFNRLEYTMLCIRNTHQMANNSDYTHIIIDQNSSDGTTEWLKSMEIEGFYNIKVKYNEKNSGDAGGMKDGFDMLDDDCEYVLQLDNDLLPTTIDFINKSINIMDRDKLIGGVMFTRDGVGTNVGLIGNPVTINDIRLYKPYRLYSILYRRSLLSKINYWLKDVNIGWVFNISNKIAGLGFKIFKIPDIRVLHIDGHPDVVKLTNSEQKHRYPEYFKNQVSKTTNYKKINYDKNS